MRLLDVTFRDAMLLTKQYLHDLESDRLLWYFRKTSGGIFGCATLLSAP
ncbi:MAG: DUF241 domain-containing protein [Sedimentisphaerales bacterium]|nr:DUF241 domain-containing protein [Sedimentisphaerales bacterium]